jgi:hypothetical protein
MNWTGMVTVAPSQTTLPNQKILQPLITWQQMDADDMTRQQVTNLGKDGSVSASTLATTGFPGQLFAQTLRVVAPQVANFTIEICCAGWRVRQSD